MSDKYKFCLAKGARNMGRDVVSPMGRCWVSLSIARVLLKRMSFVCEDGCCGVIYFKSVVITMLVANLLLIVSHEQGIELISFN